ncbi:MAG: diguanylate cyclase [Candidatus Sericytochromatia bacterium]|nr:diguanylate cyclase [Candidatus Sericytochromatia bacterium]
MDVTEASPDLGSRYRLLSQLGTGGMSVVYLVEDCQTGQQVAMKVISQALREAADQAEHLLRFKQEFRTMARLRHPNTCAVHDYGVLKDGRAYLTMEVVEGRGLDECLPMAAEAFLPVLRQLGHALQYIHQQGFVHLDLKPENIRLRDDGVVKLMDFGLMEVTGQALDAVRGTLLYLSPEVARLDRVDARSDLYALGALAYHVLAGQPPFTCASPLEYLRAHLSAVPQPLRELAPAVPPEVAHVVERLLAKEAAARYPSAEGALGALGLGADEGAQATLLESSFVGRRDEVQRLGEALSALQLGEPRHVTIAGPAGIGKSRLLGEFRVQALLEDRPWLYGRATEVGAPYGPFIEMLRGLLPLAHARCPELLRLHAAVLGTLLPELPVGEEAVPIEPEPMAARTQLQLAVVAVLTAISADGGAVLVLDEAEHLDPLSAGLLDLLRRQVPRVPLLIVVAQREAGSGWDDELALGPLTERETGALAGSVLGLETSPPQFTSALHEAARGQPGVVVAVLQHLLRQGTLTRSHGEWTLPDSLQGGQLPRDATDMLLAVVRTASEEARRLVEFAAIFGEPFTLQDARALSSLSEDDLFDALDEAIRAQIIEHRLAGYVLTSSALRLAVYEHVAPEERTQAHRAAARHLEQVHAPAAVRVPADGLDAQTVGPLPLAQLTAIASHSLRADTPARALRWAHIAAERNLEVLALSAAAGLLTRGLELVDGQAEAVPADLRFDLHNALATCLHWQHQLDLARHHVDHAEALLEDISDRARQLEWLVTAGKHFSLRSDHVKAAELQSQAIALAQQLGSARTGVRARINLGRALYFQDRRAEAREVFEMAVQEAQQQGLPSWRASALSQVGYLRAVTEADGRERGVRELSEAVAVQEAIGDKSGLVFSSNLLFELQILHGALQDAQTSAQRCVTLSGELGSIDDHVVAHLNAAIVAFELGDLTQLSQSAAEALRLAERHHHSVVEPLAACLLALLEVLEGHVERGLERARQIAAGIPRSSHYVRTLVGVYRLEALVWARQVAEAEACVTELEGLLSGTDRNENHVRFNLLRAELAAATGRLEDAAGLRAEASREAEAMGARGLSTRAATLEAALAYRQGDLRRALDLGERALEAARRLGGVWYEALALVTLSELHRVDLRPSAVALSRRLLELALARRLPWLEAVAHFELSLAQAGTGDAEEALSRAQRTVHELAAAMAPEAAAAFLAMPEARRIVAHAPAEGRGSERLTRERTFERLQLVNRELQLIAAQYDQLFRDWSTQSTQLEQLNEFARSVNHSLQLEAVLDQAVLLTLQLTSAERGFLYLLDPEPESAPRLAAAWDGKGQAIPEARASMSVLRQALQSGDIVSITDVGANEEMQAQQSIAALNLRSVMCVPLRSRQDVLGALYVDSQATLNPFSAAELELLVAVAGHTAVSIRNAMLYQSQARRAAELERLLEQYRRADFEASTDELTGLRNRRFFEDQAGREVEISRRYGRPMSLVLLDVDHFKWFNDAHGHAVGDEVLRAIGRTLAATVRSVDLPARYGGEELVVLCPDTDAAGAAGLAERIRKAVAEIHLGEAFDQPLPHVTCSLGVAAFRSGDDQLGDILARADQGLYAAKAAGRNRVLSWSPELQQSHA